MKIKLSISLHTCAPVSELPSKINTMVLPNLPSFFSTVELSVLDCLIIQLVSCNFFNQMPIYPCFFLLFFLAISPFTCFSTISLRYALPFYTHLKFNPNCIGGGGGVGVQKQFSIKKKTTHFCQIKILF